LNEIRVGLTDLSKAEGCELNFNGAGAFVWRATQANSEGEFLQKLQKALDYYELTLIEISKIRQFDESDEVVDELFEMIERVREHENWVLFGTFHSYPHREA
jgi:hypothetical protein